MTEDDKHPVPPPGSSSKTIDRYAQQKASEPLVHFGNQRDAEEYQEAMKASGPYLTLGIQLAASIAAFCGIGYWLDSVNGTSPRWLGICAAAGAVLSLVYFILTVL